EVGAAGGGFFVSPDQEETARRNGVAGGNGEFGGIGERIGQVIAGEVHEVGAVIVEFEPIVVFVAIGGVLEGVGVAGHEFVEDDGEWAAIAVVGARWRGEKELLAIEALSIGE